jgi:hypothetical protein
MKNLSSKEAARIARNYPLNVRWSDEDQAFILNPEMQTTKPTKKHERRETCG